MKKIVFVCLGNICRSPMAEFVMKALNQEEALQIESRATSSWEHGNPVHQGTQKILRKYAISFDPSKRSQQINQLDFESFDLILGMDESNVDDLLQLSAGRYDDKIKLFRSGGVPDPLVARNGRCCQLYRLQPINRNQDTAWQDWHREFNRRQYRNSGGREPTVHR